MYSTKFTINGSTEKKQHPLLKVYLYAFTQSVSCNGGVGYGALNERRENL